MHFLPEAFLPTAMSCWSASALFDCRLGMYFRPFFWCVVSGLIELIGGEDGVEQAREARVQIVVAYAEEVIGSHWPISNDARFPQYAAMVGEGGCGNAGFKGAAAFF